MRKGKRYIPQGLRKRTPKKQVKLPIRQNLSKDSELTRYYRESLLLMVQTGLFQAEKLLDSEIVIHERLVVQKLKNDMDSLILGIVEQMPENFQDLHYDRCHFLNEMMKLWTLIPPKHYENIQDWMVEKIQNLNGIK